MHGIILGRSTKKTITKSSAPRFSNPWPHIVFTRSLLYRLLWVIPLVFGITLVTFTLFSLSSSDPAEIAIRVNAMVPTPELIAQTRHELGLDLPFWTRYGRWLSGILHGDFGVSYVTRRTVVAEFADALPATLLLAVSTLCLLLTTSIPLGVLAARFEGRSLDKAIRGLIFALSAIPSFWVGLLFMRFFAVTLGWFPTHGMRETTSIVLPMVTLGLGYIPTYVRLIRTEMIHNAHENWVLAARARGVSEARLTGRLLATSLRSSVTALGMSTPKLMAGTFVVECLFAWPGIGRLCVEAIFNRDIPIVQTYVLLLAFAFVLFNLLSDILVWVLNPQRGRERGGLA